MSRSLLGGIIGAVIGFVASGYNPAGALKGFSIGMAVGSLFEPGQKVAGPRLEDLKAQSSEYGRPIPVVYGTVGLAGNVIWAADMVEESTTREVGGSLFASGTKVTEYAYFVDFAVAVCEGPIIAVNRIWAGPERRLVYDNTLGTELFEGRAVTVYRGDETQLPDPLMEAAEGVGNVPAYRGTAYVLLEHFPLARDGNRYPEMLFEVITSGAVEAQQLLDNYWNSGYTIGKYLYRYTVTDPRFTPDSVVSSYLRAYAVVLGKYGAGYGKWYLEYTLNEEYSSGGGDLLPEDEFKLGVHGVGLTGVTVPPASVLIGVGSLLLRFNNSVGSLLLNGTQVVNFGVTNARSVVGFAVDLDAQLAWVRVQGGNWNNSGTADPATGIGGIDYSGAGLGAAIYPTSVFQGDPAGSSDASTLNDRWGTTRANFGQSPPVFAAPTGYSVGWPRDVTVTTAGSVTLASVVQDLCVRAGLDAQHVDVSQLEEDLVDGYVIAKQDSVRACIGPLAQAYYFDGIESGSPECVGVVPGGNGGGGGCAPTAVFLDTFTDSDGTLLAEHTPDTAPVGVVWATYSAPDVGEISSNRFTATNGNAIAFEAVGAITMTYPYSVSLTAVAGTADYLRFNPYNQDTSDGVYLDAAGGNINLGVNGAAYPIEVHFELAPAVEYTFTILVEATQVTFSASPAPAQFYTDTFEGTTSWAAYDGEPITLTYVGPTTFTTCYLDLASTVPADNYISRVSITQECP
jgi:hypothetical protein